MTYIANSVLVEAAAIKRIDEKDPTSGKFLVHVENTNGGTTPITVTPEMASRIRNLKIGDYVVIQSDGYVYLNPKDVFERKYRSTAAMTFGQAIDLLRVGYRVARAGWSGKGTWLDLIMSGDRPDIVMSTVDGDTDPWFASLSDILAEDWLIVD